MSQAKIAIIQFPGSNCETESIHAINQASMLAEEFLWNRNPDELNDFDGFFIVGGFSFEDRSRSGVVSSKQPLMQGIIAQAKLGKPILGICNGAQILVESGLVPGLKNQQLGAALATNKREIEGNIMGTSFYNTWSKIKNISKTNLFCQNLEFNQVIPVPVAHAEGRFVIPQNLVKTMKENGQFLFQYCDSEGAVSLDFPINPNGSFDSLAAIGNPSGNVMAMMPHPERALEQGGLLLFQAMARFIENHKSNPQSFQWKELDVILPAQELSKFKLDINNLNLLIDTVITDKEVVTVQSTLNQMGIKSTIKKIIQWEIQAPLNSYPNLTKSELFWNNNKEFLITDLAIQGYEKAVVVAVNYKDNFVGKSKLQELHHQGLKEVVSVQKKVLWLILGDYQSVLDTNLLANPFSQNIEILIQ